jgi:hypothetical protein
LAEIPQKGDGDHKSRSGAVGRDRLRHPKTIKANNLGDIPSFFFFSLSSFSFSFSPLIFYRPLNRAKAPVLIAETVHY